MAAFFCLNQDVARLRSPTEMGGWTKIWFLNQDGRD